VANSFAPEVARINSLITRTIANIARDRALLAENPNRADAAQLREQIESGENYLVDLRAELQIFLDASAAPVSSSGQIVTEEARARADGSYSSNPASNPTVLAPADRINRNEVESGTNDPVRTSESTQATPAPGPNNTQATPTQTAGVAASTDDGVTSSNNPVGTQQIINASFNRRIVPEPNVLDEYASYTYAISWYLLTPDQYNQMVRSQKKSVSSWQLLIQSAGAPVGSATAAGGRNKFFSLDYYIDDLEIDSIVPLKGSGAANTATDIKFRVTEPNGITLIENLYNAVSTLYKQNNIGSQANYPMAQYCLVVRFYGYNDSGELVTTGRRGTNGSTNLTDPKAIVEKFYPCVLTNIRFKIPKDRVVEYDISAKPIPHFYNKSQDRGTIPYSFELIGQTVSQVLVGKPVGTQYPRQDGRATSAQPNVSAPSNPAASVNDISASAGVDANGNFTGETASPFSVVGA
jgi:hypothetical protein